MHTFSILFRALTLMALAMVLPLHAEEPKPEIIESLTVGAITYTNVQLINRTKSDVFIKHAGGVLNVKIKDLDKSAQLQLGYHLAEIPTTTSSNAVPVTRSRNPLPEFKIDPRWEELQEQIVWESQEFISTLPPKTLYAAGGGVFLLYLFFCSCCRQICRKTGQTSLALVWLPLFKQLPLLRAAGMSPWWLITNFLPPVFGITFIVWAFKISKARGKSPLTGVMLLLPVLNIFAFLYLAFADRLDEDDDSGNGKVFTLSQSRRAA